MPKILVFGGNGFVGSRVCEEALNTGLQVVSINRSGRPKRSDPWIKEVEWVQVNLPHQPMCFGIVMLCSLDAGSQV